MHRIFLNEDIQSISDFRANTNAFIKQVQKTKRPLILTQHGRSSAILLDVAEYEKLLDELELLHELQTARKELEQGQGIHHEEVIKQIKRKASENYLVPDCSYKAIGYCHLH